MSAQMKAHIVIMETRMYRVNQKEKELVAELKNLGDYEKTDDDYVSFIILQFLYFYYFIFYYNFA